MSYTLRQRLLNTEAYLKSPTRSMKEVKYIVVHELHSCETAECHFVVYEEEILEHIPVNFTGRHCGSGMDKVSIGIGLSDYSPQVVNHAAMFIKALMIQYNISIFNICRHYDVDHSLCPLSYVKDVGLWDQLLEQIQQESGVASLVKERQKAIVAAKEGIPLLRSMDGSRLTMIPFGEEVVVLIQDVGEEGGCMWTKIIYRSYIGYCESGGLSL